MIEATHHRRKEELSQVLSPNRIQSLRKNLPLRSPRSSCSEQAPSRRKMRALSERHTFCAVLQQYVNKYRTFLYSGGCRFTHFQGIFRAFFVKRTHIRKCVRPWKKPWKCPTLEIGLFPGLFSGFFRAFFGLFFDKNGCKRANEKKFIFRKIGKNDHLGRNQRYLSIFVQSHNKAYQ